MVVPDAMPNDLRWFYEARFGMFVHFGLYALLGRGEWVMYQEGIPRSEYERLMERFNPCRFGADAWVGLARAAGARYLTVTAKHHDGFCLFDSQLTEFKITNTPFGRDLVGELAEACHREDLPLILYYSQPDWHHPNYVHRRGAFKDLADPPATDRPEWAQYQEYLLGQVCELCTRYGRIGGIWFDGSHKTVEEWRGDEMYALIKEHQPHAVVNDRARFGDFFTPERSLPDDLTGYLFESCQSVMESAWGYAEDPVLHSGPYLVESVVRMAAAGGNLLLNVGPAPDGSIPEAQAARMRCIGQWLERHGDGVYATEPGPLFPDESLRATRKGDQVFVHLLSWPRTDTVRLEGLRGAVLHAGLAGSSVSLRVEESDAGLRVRGLPAEPPEPGVNTLRLAFAGTPDYTRPTPQEPEAPVITLDGPAELPAEAAALRGLGVKGCRLRVRALREGGPTAITGWFVPEHSAHWRVQCAAAGTYGVSVLLSGAAGAPEAVVRLVAHSQELQAPVSAGREEGGLTRLDLGRLELPAGTTEITLSPAKLHFGYVFPGVVKLGLEA